MHELLRQRLRALWGTDPSKEGDPWHPTREPRTNQGWFESGQGSSDTLSTQRLHPKYKLGWEDEASTGWGQRKPHEWHHEESEQQDSWGSPNWAGPRTSALSVGRQIGPSDSEGSRKAIQFDAQSKSSSTVSPADQTPIHPSSQGPPHSTLRLNSKDRVDSAAGFPSIPPSQPNPPASKSLQPTMSESTRALSPMHQPLALPGESWEEIFAYIEGALSLRTHTPSGNSFSKSSIASLQGGMLKICTTKSLYQRMLSLRGPQAQVLDSTRSTKPSDLERKRSILKGLLRLSQSTGSYPKCLLLSSHVWLDKQPVDQGSFGEVYRGLVANRDVAVKVFRVNKRTDLTRLMKTIWREAILWCQLYHENVLPCYGVYRSTSESYRIGLVSPWVSNGNVMDYLHKNPRKDRLLLVSDVASGMSYLHQNQIVHGDLKGANILVSTSGRACLADFGLSTLSDPALLEWTSVRTSDSKAVGTSRWQAPELLDASDDAEIRTTIRSDVYSYACVCYEIMTGNFPFHHVKNNLAVVIQVREGARPKKPSPEDPAFREFGLTEGAWAFIEACWDQDPQLRPTAQTILSHPLLSSLTDPRPPQQWRDTSASEFRRKILPSNISMNYDGNHRRWE
ncbi:hypothetical protein NMY22_g4498 [Coprinellus aureogranulatus]|nr:hypothetical protein NMY22_g4498 [Coprinellus aureogranulatus]